MIATAHVRYDSDYFEELYAQTVGYRLRLRKFAVQFATALLLFGYLPRHLLSSALDCRKYLRRCRVL